jgi:alkanesulfonate monooxygenase SsuD/methylene tetrahydromethanopterin reductase-like flavin-dependent oxidoreductase (luciferase family)
MRVKDTTVGFELICHFGEMKDLRAAWMKAEELGVDRLYTSDHLNAIPVDPALAAGPNSGTTNTYAQDNVFEGASVEAAMAATTSRAEIGCLVHSNAYRNPHMLAYIANTIDHISGGRFVLGIGTGFAQKDFEDFGIPYGTQKSRTEALMRDIPIIRDHWANSTPKPLHDIPIIIATMGEKLGLRLVAEQGDGVHIYGTYDLMAHKIEVLKQHCADVGRDFNEIELITYYWPHLLTGPDDTLENYLQLGINHIVVIAEGHDKWDTGLLRETLQWRDNLPKQATTH